MSERLTDKAAIRLALIYAIEWEESCIGSYMEQRERFTEEQKARFPLDPVTEAHIARWHRNIEAFKRVLDRYFDGARLPELGGKVITLAQMLRETREQAPPANTEKTDG